MASDNLNPSYDVGPDQLQHAVEGLHDCKAELSEVVIVHERFEGQPVWDGPIHVFTLIDHPKAKVCYAWSSPVPGTERRRFYAVLGIAPVDSPEAAVRASILRDVQ